MKEKKDTQREISWARAVFKAPTKVWKLGNFPGWFLKNRSPSQERERASEEERSGDRTRENFQTQDRPVIAPRNSHARGKFLHACASAGVLCTCSAPWLSPRRVLSCYPNFSDSRKTGFLFSKRKTSAWNFIFLICVKPWQKFSVWALCHSWNFYLTIWRLRDFFSQIKIHWFYYQFEIVGSVRGVINVRGNNGLETNKGYDK